MLWDYVFKTYILSTFICMLFRWIKTGVYFKGIDNSSGDATLSRCLSPFLQKSYPKTVCEFVKILKKCHNHESKPSRITLFRRGTNRLSQKLSIFCIGWKSTKLHPSSKSQMWISKLSVHSVTNTRGFHRLDGFVAIVYEGDTSSMNILWQF